MAPTQAFDLWNSEAIQQQWAIPADSKDLVRIEVVFGPLMHDRRRDRSRRWFEETTAIVQWMADAVFVHSNISEVN
jgi:hypothetical protein